MTSQELEIDIETIISAKRQYLAKRQDKTPSAAVVALADMQQRPKPVLNVITEGDHVTLIGQITHAQTYDPVAAALRYVRSGLDAVTLFTDQQVYTKGMDDLLLVSRGVRNHPVIYQDYILNEYHVAEARAAGASGLVLYASVLSRPDLRRVVSITQRWQMTTIIQVRSEEELDYVSQLSPHVVSVGFEPDFKRERDLPLLEKLHTRLPYNTRLMALGCLTTLEDVAAVLELGVDAIIVDETLLKPPYIFDQLRAMIEHRAEPRSDEH